VIGWEETIVMQCACRFAPHLEKCLKVGDGGASRPSRSVRTPARD